MVRNKNYITAVLQILLSKLAIITLHILFIIIRTNAKCSAESMKWERKALKKTLKTFNIYIVPNLLWVLIYTYPPEIRDIDSEKSDVGA